MTINDVKTYEEYIIHRIEDLEAKETELDRINGYIDYLKSLGIVKITDNKKSDKSICAIKIGGKTFEDYAEVEELDNDMRKELEIYRALMFIFFSRTSWRIM